MNEVQMYLNDLIKKYNNVETLDEKRKYARNIGILYSKLYYSNLIKLNSIDKLYDRVCYDKLFLAFIKDFTNIKFDINNMHNAKEDLKFISKLINHFKEQPIKKNKGKSILCSDKDFVDYISTSKIFLDFYKNSNLDIIYDKSLYNSTAIKLIDRNLILLDKRDKTILIHELMHVFSNFSVNKYSETPSILAEMGLASQYNLNDDPDRYRSIKDLKSLSIINNYMDYEKYCYSIGSLIAIAFISTHGNNFNDIIKASSILVNNDYVSLKDMFELLNMTEKDVIKGVNNYSKVLKK